jgi:hypothetical protein
VHNVCYNPWTAIRVLYNDTSALESFFFQFWLLLCFFFLYDYCIITNFFEFWFFVIFFWILVLLYYISKLLLVILIISHLLIEQNIYKIGRRSFNSMDRWHISVTYWMPASCIDMLASSYVMSKVWRPMMINVSIQLIHSFIIRIFWYTVELITQLQVTI